MALFHLPCSAHGSAEETGLDGWELGGVTAAGPGMEQQNRTPSLNNSIKVSGRGQKAEQSGSPYSVFPFLDERSWGATSSRASVSPTVT